MELTLDPGDLQPQYQLISTREVSYDKLTPQARAVVLAVGSAVFYSWNRQSYNAVYPPRNVLDAMAIELEQDPS